MVRSPVIGKRVFQNTCDVAHSELLFPVDNFAHVSRRDPEFKILFVQLREIAGTCTQSEVGMGHSIWQSMQQKGYSRRDFLQFCAAAATVAGLGQTGVAQVVSAFEKKEKPAVVWMHFQECTCCSESFIRASHPIVADALLDVLSLNYTETLMAASGFQAEKSLNDTIAEQQGQVHCAGGRRGADQGRRRLLHDRRQDRGIDSADRRQGCGGDCGLGQLRLQRLRAGGQAESDRRHADLQAGGQAGDQRARLPAHRRRDDGRGDPPAGARASFRRSTARAGPRSSTDAAFTTPAIAAPTTMPASLSSRLTTRTRARAIASTRWAAAVRSPTTPAR